jgi:hypothetical protein
MSGPEPVLLAAPEAKEALSGGCPTTSELFASIFAVFKARGFPEDAALAASYFAFSTWFSAFLPVAPCLLISGPGPEARLMLDLLECVLRNPLLIFGLTRGGFLSVDMDLEPTLLIAQEGISDSLWKLVLASNHRNAQVPTANGMRKIYCAKVMYVGDEPPDVGSNESLLQINLAPLRGRVPFLEPNDKSDLMAEFQPRMLAYRQRNYAQVCDSRFDLPELSSANRILARVLGAPIVTAPEVQASLGPLLCVYQDAIRAEVWSNPRCVVIEAVLLRCHDGKSERIYVGAITRTTNAILKGRGEIKQLGPKEVGGILRQLGLSPTRDRNGFAIRLDEGIRRVIHQLAGRFAVAAVQEGAMECAHCVEFFSPSEHGRAYGINGIVNDGHGRCT